MKLKLPKISPVWLLCGLLAVFAYILKFCLPGYGFSALVCLGIIGVIAFYTLSKKLLPRFPRAMKWLRRFFTVCLCMGLILAGITEGIILKASFGDPDAHCDYMVVLGAKVRNSGPSVSLWDRIYAARDYMQSHPDVIAVVSGGQGADEPMSEAQAMYEKLVALGIDPERIWIEDLASSTWANLNYALNLIEEKTGTRPGTLGVVSSEYHMYRAGLQAKDCGVEFVGIPAKTSRLSQAINHFMREIAGVWHYMILGGQYD